jgi:hypothetical protein
MAESKSAALPLGYAPKRAGPYLGKSGRSIVRRSLIASVRSQESGPYPGPGGEPTVRSDEVRPSGSPLASRYHKLARRNGFKGPSQAAFLGHLGNTLNRGESRHGGHRLPRGSTRREQPACGGLQPLVMLRSHVLGLIYLIADFQSCRIIFGVGTYAENHQAQ